MTGHNWKPGDVAMVPGIGIAVRTNRGSWANEKSGKMPTHFAGVYPLVVIDPDDRKQVERLRKACETTDFSPWNSLATSQLQAALRSLVTPPRPPEPTGLGAVVECGGFRFVRIGAIKRPWQREGTRDYRVSWDELDDDPITEIAPGVSS